MSSKSTSRQQVARKITGVAPSDRGDDSSGSNCETPDMPAPLKQHDWLQRFVGQWDAEVEVYLAPGQPPMKTQGINRARMLGGFWLIEEGQNTAMPYGFILTLGFDPRKKKYVGTWADSMMSYLWKYEGTVDAKGAILTLETEGPNPMDHGNIAKVREVTQFKSVNHRVFTSSRLGDDGKWIRLMTVNLRRRK